MQCVLTLSFDDTFIIIKRYPDDSQNVKHKVHKRIIVISSRSLFSISGSSYLATGYVGGFSEMLSSMRLINAS